MIHRLLICGYLLLSSGCMFLPTVSRQPVVHNPLPQLSRVAVAPFFNHSAEPTADGRRFAMAYFSELQSIPGYIVVPTTFVEQKMQEYGITLANSREVRQLAQLLEVDAIVIDASRGRPILAPRDAPQWAVAV